MLDEEGQGMVEYGLILALVAVVAVVGLNLLGVKVDELLRGVVDSFTPSTP
ncbi:MAG: Flp family type IVb pilin [Firmicutes bacterium]|nr:Flp family type IVb pilin [Bacillota bacterium]